MADLARERPRIELSELSELLNLDGETAAIIADQPITLHGAQIIIPDERALMACVLNPIVDTRFGAA